MEFLQSLLGSASSDLSSLLIYVIIVAVFHRGTGAVHRARGRHARPAARAIRSIKAGDKAKRSWQEDDFLGKGSLKAHWSAYLNNLFFADGEYHNASNVEDFINEETPSSTAPGAAHLATRCRACWCRWAFWAR